MVLDGFFIIVFFLKKHYLAFHVDDPIYLLLWQRKTLNCDLVLLANQIPFFILQNLFDLIVQTDEFGSRASFVDIALSFLNRLEETSKVRIMHSNIPIQHLLHLLQTTYVASHDQDKFSKKISLFIPCASKLEEAGIKFRKSDCNYLNIKFWKDVIEMPCLEIWDKTHRIF